MKSKESWAAEYILNVSYWFNSQPYDEILIRSVEMGLGINEEERSNFRRNFLKNLLDMKIKDTTFVDGILVFMRS